jgi:hypothetical protein
MTHKFFKMYDDDGQTTTYSSDTLEDIIYDEFDLQDEDKTHLNYYVGVYSIDTNDLFLLMTSVTPHTLFKYEYTENI